LKFIKKVWVFISVLEHFTWLQDFTLNQPNQNGLIHHNLAVKKKNLVKSSNDCS